MTYESSRMSTKYIVSTVDFVLSSLTYYITESKPFVLLFGRMRSARVQVQRPPLHDIEVGVRRPKRERNRGVLSSSRPCQKSAGTLRGHVAITPRDLYAFRVAGHVHKTRRKRRFQDLGCLQGPSGVLCCVRGVSCLFGILQIPTARTVVLLATTSTTL